jgi:hypothetical protein
MVTEARGFRASRDLSHKSCRKPQRNAAPRNASLIFKRIADGCTSDTSPPQGSAVFSPVEFVLMKRLIVGALAVVFAGCGGDGDDASSSQGTQRLAGPPASTGPSGPTEPEGPLGPLGHTGATEPQGLPMPRGPEETFGAVGAVTSVEPVGPIGETDRLGLMGPRATADRVGARNAQHRSSTDRADTHR